jgi:hypothetical protein
MLPQISLPLLQPLLMLQVLVSWLQMLPAQTLPVLLQLSLLDAGW